jgi:AhpD family alkylhydroperoxidase
MYDMKHLNRLPELNQAPAMAGFQAFDATALAEGIIPARTKELIAIAVALTTQCPYCLEIHGAKARKLGVTSAEIAEVVMVAAALRAGAAITHGLQLLTQPEAGQS